MADLNHVVIIGRLTRDAELKYTANGGQAISKIAVAVNRRKKNGDTWEDEASFFDVVIWGRQAESLNQYLTKGKQIAVEGELRQERWQQQDGQNRLKVEIVAKNIQLLGGGGNNSGESEAKEQKKSHSSNSQSSAPSHFSPPESDDGFADDIPF